MRSLNVRPDFTGVTETPGDLVSREAASMAISRYDLVRCYSKGRRVLEIACGSGQGLGYVGADAARLVAGDITWTLLERARRHYGSRFQLLQFDAQDLPFIDGTFDLVSLHEALYYMPDIGKALRECRRVLVSGGLLVISSINSRWLDFNPSPHAVTYLDAPALEGALSECFSTVELQYGFPEDGGGFRSALVSTVKRLAVRLRLIPKTMKGKALLKYLFLGPLQSVPPEIPRGFAPIDRPHSAGRNDSTRFKVIYAVARA